MECPGCGVIRFKAPWTPAQWKASSAYCHGRAYCMLRDPNQFGRQFSDALASLECLRMLLVNYRPSCQRFFHHFMDGWKQTVVGTDQSIELHRAGALCIFSDESEDAGNKVYLTLMRLIAPQWLVENYPSNVTPRVVGNLVESLLGYFLVRPLVADHPGKGFKKFLCVAIRLLRCISPCLGNTEWCRWNVYTLDDIERCIRVNESSWAKPRLCN